MYLPGKRSVTVHNKGDRIAILVDIRIEADDRRLVVVGARWRIFNKISRVEDEEAGLAAPSVTELVGHSHPEQTNV